MRVSYVDLVVPLAIEDGLAFLAFDAHVQLVLGHLHVQIVGFQRVRDRNRHPQLHQVLVPDVLLSNTSTLVRLVAPVLLPVFLLLVLLFLLLLSLLRLDLLQDLLEFFLQSLLLGLSLLLLGKGFSPLGDSVFELTFAGVVFGQELVQLGLQQAVAAV